MAHRSVGHAAASAAQILAQTAGSLASTALAARALGPDRMGVYGLLVFVQAIVGVLAAGGWPAAATRFVAQHGDRPEVASAAFRLAVGKALRNSLLLAATVLAVAMLAAFWPVDAAAGQVGGLGLRAGHGVGDLWPLALGAAHGLPAAWGIALAAGLVPAALFAVLLATWQARQRFDRIAKVGAGAALLQVAGTLAIVRSHHGIAALLLLGAGVWSLQAVALALPLRDWLRDWLRGSPGLADGVESNDDLAIEGVPRYAGAIEGMPRYARACLVMSLLDSVVWQRSEVFFLGLWATHAAIAQYVLAYGLASTAMKALPGALVPLLVPAMARISDRQALARAFGQATRWMALLAVPTAVGLAMVAPEVIRALYGVAYAPAANLLALLGASNAAVMALGYPASSVLYATDGERAIARVGVVVAVLNVLLAIALIPVLGATGAAVANCGAQLASLGPGLYLAFRRIPGRLEPRHLAVPLLASACMVVPVELAARLPGLWQLAIGIPAGSLTYAAAIVMLGGVDGHELRSLRVSTHKGHDR